MVKWRNSGIIKVDIFMAHVLRFLVMDGEKRSYNFRSKAEIIIGFVDHSISLKKIFMNAMYT